MKIFSIVTHAACVLAGAAIAAYILKSGGAPLEMDSGNPPKSASNHGNPDYASRAMKHKQDAARQFLQTLPVKENGSERKQWLEDLSSEQYPRLLEALCMETSPTDLEFSEGELVSNTLQKWMKENPEACISWVNQLPVGSMKRDFLGHILRELMNSDPERALAISEAYQAEDPAWKHSVIKDAVVYKEIEKTWKNPNFTAAELLALHNKLERSNGTTGYRWGEFPKAFDFQIFFDGLFPPIENGNPKMAATIPIEAMNTWVRRDPQAATAWFLKTLETGYPFMYACDWAELSKGITAISGAAGYHEWAADILTHANEKLFDRVVQKIEEPDMLDIVGAISNPDIRDRALSIMASSQSFNLSHVVTFIGSMSTPEAKLDAISNGSPSHFNFNEWLEKGSLKPDDWQKLGLSETQVRTAIKNKTN